MLEKSVKILKWYDAFAKKKNRPIIKGEMMLHKTLRRLKIELHEHHCKNIGNWFPNTNHYYSPMASSTQ